jgi:hypothetical protein
LRIVGVKALKVRAKSRFGGSVSILKKFYFNNSSLS